MCSTARTNDSRNKQNFTAAADIEACSENSKKANERKEAKLDRRGHETSCVISWVFWFAFFLFSLTRSVLSFFAFVGARPSSSDVVHCSSFFFYFALATCVRESCHVEIRQKMQFPRSKCECKQILIGSESLKRYRQSFRSFFRHFHIVPFETQNEK